MQTSEPPPAKPGRGWFWLLVAVAMLAASVAALVVSSGMRGHTARRVGTNTPLNAGAIDRLDPTAHNSPVVAANPRDPANLAVAARIDAPKFSCDVHVSLDGGATWRATPLPVPDSGVVACFAPDATFGADGRLYVAYTSWATVEGLGKVPEAVWVLTSTDGGRTFAAPVKAHGPLAFQMRLTADPDRAGRLYLSWLQAADSAAWGLATAGRPIVVSRSDDGGATWSEPVNVTPPQRQRVVAPALAVGSGGRLHVAYLDVGDDRLDYHGGHEGMGGDPYPEPWSLVVAASSDAGATWSEAVLAPPVVPTQRFLMLFPPGPSIATRPGEDHVYVGFQDGSEGDADVRVWASADGGRRWGPARRVNNTPPRDGTDQYLPQLAVAPNGRLDVVYYDRRRSPKAPRNEVSLQSSFDHGRSFEGRLALSDRSFDATIGFGDNRNMAELGNRLGMLSTDKGALAVWADTRSGQPEIRKQDLASALVVFLSPDPLKEPLRIGGLALGGLGIVLLLTGIVTLQRRSARRRLASATPATAPY